MAIVKSGLGSRDARADRQPSPATADASSTDSGDDEVHTASAASSEASSGASEVDSGMESDDCDYASLGEPGTEFCQVGNQTCLVPHELYDLPELSSVLSVDTWNESLTEEERLALAEHLPDMDQETFVRTLTEVLSGDNFYFGSPVKQLFDQLKGGLCEPRVVLYRRGMNYLQRRKHYHWLRKYHNGMIGRLAVIKDVWENSAAYGIEERLQAVKMAKDQKRPLRLGKHGQVVASETDSEEEDDRLITWKNGLKMGRRAVYPPRPAAESFAYGTGLPLETSKYGKENAKGTLKVSGSKKGYIGLTGKVHPSVDRAPEMDHRGLAPPHDGRYSGLSYRSETGLRNQMKGYDVDEYEDNYDAKGPSYEMGTTHHGTRMESVRKHNKLKRHKQAPPVNFDYADDANAYNDYTLPKGKRDASKVMGMPSHDSRVHKKPRPSYRDWEGMDEDEDQQLIPKGAWSGRAYAGNMEKGSFSKGSSFDFPQKGNKSSKTYQGHVGSASDIQLDNVKRNPYQNGGRGSEHAKGRRSSYVQAEDTQSDSSEAAERGSDDVPLSRKLQYQTSFDNHQNADVRTIYPHVKSKKHAKNSKSDFADAFDGDGSPMQGVEFYKQKGKQKSKVRTNNYMNDPLPDFVLPTGKFIDDQKQNYRMNKREEGPSPHGFPQLPPVKPYVTEKKKKGLLSEYSSPHSDYMREYPGVWMDDADGADGFRARYTENNNQDPDAYAAEADNQGHMGIPPSGSRSASKKRKGKTSSAHVSAFEEPQFQQTSPDSQVNVSVEMKKGKRKLEAESGLLPDFPSDPMPMSPERESFEIETKPARKPFTLITPTVHTGFSFSIVHLLSAVRKAMITVNMEENGTNISQPFNSLEGNSSDEQRNLPPLTVQEIVNLVKSNPGDPCILETQEPLQDLVRGVLKILSSRTAPLGAKGWKQLVAYEKSNKSWYWTGPVTPSSSDPIEEETSAEAWDIPHKMLVKLVDAFANWLKSGQETLRQIGSLPPPPVADLSYLDEKERFRDLRAQKSLVTIVPSTDEIRAYFRLEEYLRYQVPDRAFSYTAADGKKSIVAPLRRGGGKPTSKARDHFMLKQNRPPHVTILCLVRDAAARLPGSIGTRADVCILLRDSQYIVEDVTDTQVNQVVSGALDRLHYERDPCVQYDSEKKLWVYLHREREEEDFEDDGTSSTKKWKKPRKDDDNPDAGNEEQDAVGVSGYGFNSDPNADPSLNDDKPELVYNDLRPNTENVEPFIDSRHGGMHQPHPVRWQTVNTDSRQEDERLLCQENSTSENFDDEAFAGRPVVY